jgi:hypothetical protein
MKCDRHTPQGRVRFYRWLGLSVVAGLLCSVLVAGLGSVLFDILPSTPGRPKSFVVFEDGHRGDSIVFGQVDHWLLSSTSCIGVAVPRNYSFVFTPGRLESWMKLPPQGAPVGLDVTTHAFGWPLRCLVREELPGGPRPAMAPILAARRGVIVPNAISVRGLIADTAVIGSPVFVWGWGLGAVRRGRRRRRVACEGCGYSLLGNVSGVCPECGGSCRANRPSDA